MQKTVMGLLAGIGALLLQLAASPVFAQTETSKSSIKRRSKSRAY